MGIAALGGIAAMMLGQAVDPRISQYFVFYDSALPAVAGAVVVAILLSHRVSAVSCLVATIAAFVVLVSFRRSAWLALVAVVCLVIILNRSLRSTVARRSVVATSALGVTLVVVPDLANAVFERIAGAAGVITGGSVDAFSAGHLSDLSVGLKHAQDSPLTGVGAAARQLPGQVATKSDRIYIHNEWLLDWLRFGLIGATLVTIFILVSLRLSVRRLRAERQDPLILVAAAFVAMASLAMFTAPFLSTTARWPLLFGIAAGLLAATAGTDDRLSLTPSGSPPVDRLRAGDGENPPALRLGQVSAEPGQAQRLLARGTIPTSPS
jgi:O-antigen ligase